MLGNLAQAQHKRVPDAAAGKSVTDRVEIQCMFAKGLHRVATDRQHQSYSGPLSPAKRMQPKMIMALAHANSPGEFGWNHGDFITIVSAQ